MRKGFTFLLSYYRVFKKLKTDKQRAELAEAIFKVQFLEARVEELAFSDPLLDIAWEGMKHSLAASIEGYLAKAKNTDHKGVYEVAEEVAGTPCQGGADTPCQQEKEKEKEKEKEEEEEKSASAPVPLYVTIIEDLNEVTGKNFSYKTSHTQGLINARIREGATLEDFLHVNRVKAEEWLETDNAKYLRPATLYNSEKFDGYKEQDFKAKITQALPEHIEKGSIAYYAHQAKVNGSDIVEAEAV